MSHYINTWDVRVPQGVERVPRDPGWVCEDQVRCVRSWAVMSSPFSLTPEHGKEKTILGNSFVKIKGTYK